MDFTARKMFGIKVEKDCRSSIKKMRNTGCSLGVTPFARKLFSGKGILP
jgi:hypothetical protein